MTTGGLSSLSANSLPWWKIAAVLAVPRLRPLTRGVVGARIAIGAEQRLARRGLRLVALRAHEAALVVDVAVREAEHADVAFAVEGDVGHLRRVLEVRPDAVERAVEVGG